MLLQKSKFTNAVLSMEKETAGSLQQLETDVQAY